jgi:hypothetical protein
MSAHQTPPPGSPGAAARPFSIRLTDEERRLLAARAGVQPLGAYVRNVILDDAFQAPRQRMRRAPTPVRDHEALARVLAALGQSRLSSNLNQLAKAVNIGALPVTPETEQEISDACIAISTIRRDLMRALGFGAGACQ